jgi:hypothetical protein
LTTIPHGYDTVTRWMRMLDYKFNKIKTDGGK